ncbi:MAG: aspartate kinase, partial [Bacteroidales bacterium]|nr:aspartate kinase [Bacteroidales bacterium]
MKVFKFGGASVKDAGSVKNLASIVKTQGGDKLLVVISAMGKTTNAFERVLNAWLKGDTEKALTEAKGIYQYHLQIA